MSVIVDLATGNAAAGQHPVSDTIDADTHIVEGVDVWSHFEGGGRLPKPYLVEAPDPDSGARRTRWVIDGRLVPKPDGMGGQALATPPLPEIETGDAGDVLWSWRTMTDVPGRLRDCASRGIGRQVIYPTLFLAQLTEDPELQVALSRSYNRYLGERWAEAGGALSWVVVPPALDVAATLRELEYGKENGAVGVMFHGIEVDRSLGDPYFFPIYAKAEELDLAICVHTGPGSNTMLNFQDSRLTRNFGQNRVLPLIGFHDLVFCAIPERFPSLRFGFLEASASWAPFILHFLRRSAKRAGRDRSFYGPTLFRDYRMYIALEADEDIRYLAGEIGWDHLIIGTDYGHTDQSVELDVTQKLIDRTDLDANERNLILCENPSAFYGL